MTYQVPLLLVYFPGPPRAHSLTLSCFTLSRSPALSEVWWDSRPTGLTAVSVVRGSRVGRPCPWDRAPRHHSFRLSETGSRCPSVPVLRGQTPFRPSVVSSPKDPRTSGPLQRFRHGSTTHPRRTSHTPVATKKDRPPGTVRHRVHTDGDRSSSPLLGRRAYGNRVVGKARLGPRLVRVP